MIAIVDHGMGNLGSVNNMLMRLGIVSVQSSDRSEIAAADGLILAGVGSFDGAMERLESDHLIDVLHQRVLEDRVPVLGVCLGMQLMSRSSSEGVREGLGWLNAHVERFSFGPENQLPIPHMGWEAVVPARPSPLFDDAESPLRFYFSHAYHVVCHDPGDVAAVSTYGEEFTAAVHKGNILGTQFHPEKSHTFGLDLYRRFAELVGG